MWAHSQNLNGNGSMWRHGRAWLHSDRLTLRVEWSIFKRDTFALGFNVGSGDSNRAMRFHFALPRIVSLWLSLDGILPRKWASDWRYWGPFGRDTDIRVFDRAAWLSFWHNDDESRFLGWPKITGLSIRRSKRGPGFMVSFYPVNFLLGRPKYSEKPIKLDLSKVVLPEAEYPVSVKIFESTWKRPRWPWPTKMIRAEVEAINQETGIPAHAGKGENAWDLADDAVFAATLPVATVEEAVMYLANSIMRDRKKYGPPDVADHREVKL